MNNHNIKPTIQTLAFSPNGEYIATGWSTTKNNLILYDVKNASLIASLDEHKAPVNLIIFSPDGSHIASVSSTNLLLHNVNTKKLIGTISDRSNIKAVAFSPDGQSIFAISEETISSYNISNKEVSRKNHVLPTAITQLVLSPDGQSIAVQQNNDLRLYNINQNTLDIELTGNLFANNASALVFSPDGQHIAFAFKNNIYIYNAKTKQLIAQLQDPDALQFVTNLKFSPNNTYIASINNLYDYSLTLWNFATMTKIDSLAKGQTAMAFSLDEKSIAYGKSSLHIRTLFLDVEIRALDELKQCNFTDLLILQRLNNNQETISQIKEYLSLSDNTKKILEELYLEPSFIEKIRYFFSASKK